MSEKSKKTDAAACHRGIGVLLPWFYRCYYEKIHALPSHKLIIFVNILYFIYSAIG